ncbi:hypothetical protein GPJ56_006532 [Histomonas meleagridis]|uniref:uncharacterized protein n=1 Tax=Histomonas meleagridis TaxID=135588 RepID=UPI003559CE30|nr:hypothetical protein GPJ56_006532 [Histomonas meleagridis]KAH0801769.1 hypothetical protein GO595_005450 [Histomonas meleagridis]
MWIKKKNSREFNIPFEDAIKKDNYEALVSLIKENEIDDINKLGKVYVHPESHFYISIGSYAFCFKAEKCLEQIQKLGYNFTNDDAEYALRSGSLDFIKKYCQNIIFNDPHQSFQSAAASSGSIEILKYMYTNGVTFEKGHFSIPILNCAQNGNIDCFKFLAEITNFGNLDTSTFTKVAEAAAKCKKSQIIDFIYDTYPDEIHRNIIRPMILTCDAVESYIKEYGTSEIPLDQFQKLAKSNSVNIIKYAYDNNVTVPTLSLEDISRSYCWKCITFLVKGREKEAFNYLMQKGNFTTCGPLLDVIELTPKECGELLQYISPDHFAPYNKDVTNFNGKFFSKEFDIEGSDLFLYLLSHCNKISDSFIEEQHLFERYPHSPKEYYDNSKSHFNIIRQMIKYGLKVNDLITQDLIIEIVQTSVTQYQIEQIVKEMDDPKQCLIWTIEASDNNTAATYREIIHAFLNVRPELRDDIDVIKAVQTCVPGWDSTPLFIEFKVGICPSLIEYFQREHETSYELDDVFMKLNNDEKIQILFSATFFGNKMLKFAQPSMRFDGESLIHNFLRRNLIYSIDELICNGGDLSFAENEGEDPVIFQLLRHKKADVWLHEIKARNDLLEIMNREGKTVNEIVQKISK